MTEEQKDQDWKPLEAWEDALRAMRGGDVIRTVLLPEPVPS